MRSTKPSTFGPSEIRDSPDVNRTRSFPIVALEMLTQRVPQIHCDYLQPHSMNSEAKSSPLALLAATCSSIGKNDPDKGKETNAKSSSPKVISSKPEDSKSSFKPYKQEQGKPAHLQSFVKPETQSSGSGVETSTTYGFHYSHGRYPTSMLPSDVDKRIGCPSSYYEGGRDSSHIHSILKCQPTTSLTPPKSLLGNGHHSLEHECSQCATMRNAPHEPMGGVLTSARSPSVCPCGLCNQMRSSIENGVPLSSIYASKLPPSPSAVACRDPNCTNCTKLSQPIYPGYLHPAYLHQCVHGKNMTPYQPPTVISGSHTSLLPPDSYLKSNGSGSTQSFICNWVSENKHCGKSFPSSEELLQHLRTHTSHAQGQGQPACGTVNHDSVPLVPQLPGTQVPCNIHGCPCRYSKSVRPSGQPFAPLTPGGSMRYHPYSRVPSIPPPSGAYPHSYLPHSVMHY